MTFEISLASRPCNLITSFRWVSYHKCSVQTFAQLISKKFDPPNSIVKKYVEAPPLKIHPTQTFMPPPGSDGAPLSESTPHIRQT